MSHNYRTIYDMGTGEQLRMGALADLLTQIERCKKDGYVDTYGVDATFCMSEGGWLELLDCARLVGESLQVVASGDEIERLRAELATAHEARKQAQIGEQRAIEARNRSALDVRRQEVAPLQAKLTAALRTVESQHEEIVASQARESTLRAAMLRSTNGGCSCLTKTPDPAYHKSHCGYRILMEALALPHDDSALKERLTQELKRCAKVCDAAAKRALDLQEGDAHGLPNVMLRHRATEAQDCAAAIRAIGEHGEGSCS